jgi:hypothetical protein
MGLLIFEIADGMRCATEQSHQRALSNGAALRWLRTGDVLLNGGNRVEMRREQTFCVARGLSSRGDAATLLFGFIRDGEVPASVR